jgi:hypothetical protein
MDIVNIKDEIRARTEKVLQSLLEDPKYDLSGAEWSLWVSYRAKNQCLCLSPTFLVNQDLDTLKFFHLPLFYFVKQELKKYDWDTETISSFQISSYIIHKISRKSLPEQKTLYKILH